MSLQHLAERGTPAGSARLREQVAMDLAGSGTGPTANTVPGWAIALAVAVAMIAVIGGTSLLLGGSDNPAISLPPAQSTNSLQVPTTVAADPVPIVAWSPLLSETAAKVPPPAETCQPETTPDLPGDIDQVRPGEGPWNNQAAVFDDHAEDVDLATDMDIGVARAETPSQQLKSISALIQVPNSAIRDGTKRAEGTNRGSTTQRWTYRRDGW